MFASRWNFIHPNCTVKIQMCHYASDKKCTISASKCSENRLATGLRRDPKGTVKRGGEGRGKGKKGRNGRERKNGRGEGDVAPQWFLKVGAYGVNFICRQTTVTCYQWEIVPTSEEKCMETANRKRHAEPIQPRNTQQNTTQPDSWTM